MKTEILTKANTFQPIEIKIIIETLEELKDFLNITNNGDNVDLSIWNQLNDIYKQRT